MAYAILFVLIGVVLPLFMYLTICADKDAQYIKSEVDSLINLSIKTNRKYNSIINKKVFISQPTTDKTIKQMREDRKEIEYLLRAKGYNVIDFVDEDIDSIKHKSVYRLGESIKMLSLCDVVYFMQGYETDINSMLEYQVAKKYNIPMYFDIKEI
jgi:hypothetical protein